MKLGIMSDSHEHLQNIAKAISIFNAEKVDLIFHCGDIISPITAAEFKKSAAPIIFVYGNNDGEKLFLKKKFEECGFIINRPPIEIEKAGKKILLMHEPDNLEALIKSEYFDLILYGHTHNIDLRNGKTVVINPGETCGYLTARATIVLLDTKTMSYTLSDL